MIYAMRERETGWIKIGMSYSERSARRSRRASIQSARAKKLARPCHLEFLCWVDWPHTAEREIHRYCWQSWKGDEFIEDSERLRFVLECMAGRAGGYHKLMRAIRAASDLPNSWMWKNRDSVLRAHRDRLSVTP